MINISEIARNRAEEYGVDLWSEFVIPPYYSKLELLQNDKPSVIEGGRGSGKTMLLRFLCHDSQFSLKKNLKELDFSRIGIYWKMDTQFAKIMSQRGENEDLWMQAFINMAVLVLSREILRSLENIYNYKGESLASLEDINFSELCTFDSTLPIRYNLLRKFLHKQYNKFQVWVSNYKKIQQPLFYPLEFILELINCIKEQVSFLDKSVFHVYIDEYENLLCVQKKIINTWVKHSQMPLIFNLAMKHNAFDIRDTLGEEKIVEVHDFRKFDIEKLIGDDFRYFASEIFLLKMKKSGFEDISINEKILFDVSNEKLDLRRGKEYRKELESRIKAFFPGYTCKELAIIVAKDEKLREKISTSIKEALMNRGFTNTSDFINFEYPEAMLVMPALLNRNTLQLDKILSEFRLYIQKKDSNFINWIDNNLFGCILNFYGRLNKICPLYAGYEAFITMSKDNIRHFLELCYASLAQVQVELSSEISVNPKLQASAVKQVSTNMLKEIKALGPNGNKLYSFALRLGTLFEEGRKRISQSEPEQTQFNIKDNISQKSQQLLDELVKWSVLYDSKLTKQKDLESGIEYQLNPIYSSYFTISYRKKRRMSIDNTFFEVISFGDAAQFEALLRQMTTSSNDNSIQQCLFKDL